MTGNATPHNEIVAHYARDSLAEALIARLGERGIAREAITLDHLGAVDQMHVRGHEATLELAQELGLGDGMSVLDLGAGIGGPARVFAARHGARVTALDLTPALCEANRALTALAGLSERVTVVEGDATRLPFDDGAFDRVATIHASMNIERKRSMYREAYRVLRPGGRFGFYDIVAGIVAGLEFPLPWASRSTGSFLVSSSTMRALAEEAGFTTLVFRDLTNVAREHLLLQEKEAAARKAAGAPPPLQAGDILMGPTASDKQRNLRRAIKEARVGLAMAVFEKPPG